MDSTEHDLDITAVLAVQAAQHAAVSAASVSSYVVTGDLSDVMSFTDTEFARELADARRRRDGSRHNRAGLAYADAVMAVRVLEAEQRRRARLSGRPEFAAGHPCTAMCWGAGSDAASCICECGGSEHGRAHRPVVASGRDPFALLGAVDSDEGW